MLFVKELNKGGKMDTVKFENPFDAFLTASECDNYAAVSYDKTNDVFVVK